MKTIIFNKNGIEEKKMFKKDFTDMFSLNIRDLRPVFSILQVATILPRKDAVIINLGFIKAILSNDTVYFLQQFDSERFDKFLDRIKGKLKERENNFTTFILEEIFEAKIWQMMEKNQKITDWVNASLPKIQKNLSEASLKEMFLMKKKITKLETRLKEILNATEEILEDEENFSELEKIVNKNKKDSFELESILENFLEQIEDQIGKLNQLKEEVESTEEFIDLTLSTKRTKMTRFDLVATVFTLILTILSVIVGLYGVNLYNGFEESKVAFKILALILVLLLIFGNLFFFWFFRKEKIL